MTKLLFIVLLLGAAPAALAQTTVSGALQDPDGQPVPFATVGLMRAGGEPVGALSGADGRFRLSVPRGVYTLEARALGYRPLTRDSLVVDQPVDLGTLYLEASPVRLDEVVVRGQRSRLVSELGKKTLLVGEDLVNAGATAVDALEVLPSVVTTVDGNISVRGNENVVIYINGKETKRDPKTLRFIPADALQRVELITNPSAKYDAEGVGGIINLMYARRRSTKLEAFASGSLPFRAAYGLNGTVATRKATFYMNVNQRHSRYEVVESQDRRSPADSVRRYRLNADSDGRGLSRGIATGVSYEFDTTFSLNLEFNYTYWDERADEDQRYAFETATATSGIDLDNAALEIEDEISSAFALEKTFSAAGTLTFQATAGGEAEVNEAAFNRADQDLSGTPIPQRLSNSDETETQRYLQFKLDYTLPLFETAKVEVGAVSDLFGLDVDQALLFRDAPAVENAFEISTRKHGGYAVWSQRLGPLEYGAGVRYEDFRSRIRSLSADSTFTQDFRNLFPSLQVNYRAGPHTVGFSFSRRISRPSFWELSPFLSYADQLNVQTGNPFLKPELASVYELTYTADYGKVSLDLTAFRRRTERVVQRVSSQLTTNQLLVSYDNFGARHDDGLEWGVAYDLGKLSLEANGSGYHTAFEEETEAVFFQERWNWQFSVKQILRLGKGWRLDCSQRYQGRRYSAQSVSLPQYYLDAGVQKKLKDDKGVLILSVRDAFDTRVFANELRGPGFTLTSSHKWQTRVLTFTVRRKIVR